MGFVFAPSAAASVPVVGSEQRFPVHRIYCVGQNYAAHAREMGTDPDREPPCFFMKPGDAVVCPGSPVRYPPATNDLHYEMELVVAIGGEAEGVPDEEATECIFGYGVGLDLTRRDLQSVARRAGRPWDMAKGFDGSAPVSAIVPLSQTGHPESGRIWLDVNGERRQSADISHMIWSVPEIVAALSCYVTLVPGDLVFTGTPAGVGPVVRGDVLEGAVEGVAELKVVIE